MNVLRCTRLAYVSALFLLLLSLLFIFPADSRALSVVSLGDYDNISVLEVSGDFNAFTPTGQVNDAPRQAVAREFYRTHGDDYDFLVLFAGFDFAMPSGSMAFYLPIKNDVEGIGQDLFDQTSNYSADGAFLERLGGIIDMGPAARHVLEPSDPRFEKTLLTLTHEMLHRWGAYVRFMDDGQPSDALLGLADAHWSFLLDAEGSSLYGNHWRDNLDGTFTTVPPEQGQSGAFLGRIFSPLELYLMGLAQQDQVPPFRLIDSPGIDRSRLPEVGVTIPGTLREIGIDKIIAAEGERFPSVDVSREFRMAFIYAVAPGNWNPEDPATLRQLAEFQTLQREWETRFAILTEGAARLKTQFVIRETVESNPGLEEIAANPAIAPSVLRSVDWLLSRKRIDGSWQDQPGTGVRDTATAVRALKSFPAGAASALAGETWLSAATPENHDFLARALLAQTQGEISGLVTAQNNDGGWGSGPGYRSNPVDTALALMALGTRGGANNVVIAAAVNYLHGTQSPDGGWNISHGASMIQPTAYALLALNGYRDNPVYTLESTVADGMNWLVSRQNGDGGFGNSPSTVYDTAIALSALKATGVLQANADRAINYLLNTQADSGSWHGNVFQTAMAVDALYAGQVAADLIVTGGDVAITPAEVTAYPTQVQVDARIHNSGGNAATQVVIALYKDAVTPASLEDQTVVTVLPNSFVDVSLTTTVNDPFDRDYIVMIDPAGLIKEASRANNSAKQNLPVNVPAPVVGFRAVSSSGVEMHDGALEVALAYAWDRELSVAYAANDLSTAIQPDDFALPAGQLVFAPGETAKMIIVSVFDDLLAEGSESVLVDLSSPSAGALGQKQHAYTIIDNDTPPTLSFSKTSGADWEDVSSVQVDVSLNFPWFDTVTVEYRPDASSTAISGIDFSGTTGTLTFFAGETTKTINLQILEDVETENDESVVIVLENPVGANLGNRSFTYTIKDNDAIPRLSINPVNGSGSEEIARHTFFLSLDHAWANTVSVTLNVATDSTAKFGDDFSLSSTVVNFSAGERTRVVTLDVVDDPLVEEDESVVIDLVHPVNAVLLQNRVRYTIINNDIAPTITITVPADGAITADNTPLIGYEISGGSVTLFVNGNEIPYVASGQALPELPDGENLLKVVATDEVGRRGYGEVSFVVDTTPPVVNIISPVPGSTPDVEPLLFYTLNEGLVTSVRVDGIAVPVANGSRLGPFLDGNYSLRIDARDAVGNTVVSEVNFRIDRNGVAESPAPEEPAYTIDWTQSMPKMRRTYPAGQGKNFIVVGNEYIYFLEDKNFGSQYQKTNYSPVLTKRDMSGNTIWELVVGSAFDDKSTNFVTDGCGTIYITGFTRDQGCMDDTTTTCYEWSDDENFLIKVADLGNSGEVQWARVWGSIQTDYPMDLLIHPGGDVYVVGYAGGPISGSWGTTDNKSFFTRFSSDGVKSVNINKEGGVFSNITLGPDGYFYIRAREMLQLDKDGNTIGTVPAGDAYRAHFTSDGGFYGISNPVRRYDSSGNIVWQAEKIVANPLQAGGTVYTFVTHGAVDKDGNIYLAGYTSGFFDGYENLGSNDVFVFKYNRDGQKLWHKQFGTPDNDRTQQIFLDDSGDVFISYEGDYHSTMAKMSGPQTPNPSFTENIYYLRSNSACGQTTSGKGPLSTTLNPLPGACAGPDTIEMRYNGGPKDLLVAFRDHGGYSETTRVDGTFFGSSLNILSESASGTGYVDLIELNPVTGAIVQTLATASFPFAAGKREQFGNLRTLGGVVNAGNTFGIKISAKTNSRSAVSTSFGQEGGCPAGGRQWINVSEKPVEFAPPISTINAPANQASVQLGYAVVEGSAQDNHGSGVVKVEVSADGGETWGIATDISTDHSWSTWKYVWVESGSGRYTITSRATDKDGNVEISGTGVELVVESLVPYLVVNPVPSPTNQLSLEISGNTRPGAVISLSSAASMLTFSPVVQNPDGAWSLTVSNLSANSDNVFAVSATNSYGMTSKTVTISVDTSPPSLTVGSLPSVLAVNTITMTGTAESGSSLVVEHNPPSISQPIAIDMWGTWRHGASLHEGANLFKFTATDPAGNETSRSVTISYLPPPQLAVSLSRVAMGKEEATDLVMTLSNVDPGSDVFVEELIDVNANGVPDSDEPVIRRFKLRDGLISNDPNYLGDEDGAADGSIITTLNYQFVKDVFHTPGSHLFQVTAGLVVKKTQLLVERESGQQSIQGFVLDDLSRPVSGAILQLIDKWGRPVDYGHSEENGGYYLPVAESGEYRVVPYAAGFVCNKNLTPMTSVGSGVAISQNLFLTAAAYQIAGTIKNSETASGIPGVRVRAENDLYVGSALSNFSGEYLLALPQGDYDLYVDSFTTDGPSAKQYLGSVRPILNVVVAGDSSGHDIALHPSTVLYRGKVTGQFQDGISGAPVQGRINDGSGLVAHAVTDANGNYALGLINIDSWLVSLVDSAAQGVGYVGNRPAPVTAGSGVYVINDLAIYPIDAWVTGTVVDSNNQTVAKVPVELSNSATGVVVEGTTATDGTYRLGVHNGEWDVAIHAEVLGYEPMASEQAIATLGQTAVVDFTVFLPLQPLAVDVDPVQSPTDQSSQLLSGNRSVGAMITVTVDGSASLGGVGYPTANTWACPVTLAIGTNTFNVTASAGMETTATVTFSIDYQPPGTNSIVITNVSYHSKKKTLTVYATSDLGAAAALELAGAGPLSWNGRQARWERVETGVTVKPDAVTVYGPEGSVTLPVN